MNPLRRWLKDFLHPPAPRASVDITRARPGQRADSIMYAWATGPDTQKTLAMYAYNNWVNTAINRLAGRSATAAMFVVDRQNPIKRLDDHPLVQLLGEYGRPNDGQTAIEFWENHFTTLDGAGNVYWYWYTQRAGAPQEVHLLEPWQMRVVPGAGNTVAKYVYTVMGEEFDLSPAQVTHFRRPNPYDRYYGLSALYALQVEVSSDRSMALWNAQFFGEDVGIPAGILVIPSSVSEAERDRVADELNARHGGRRRTAVMRAEPGSTVYIPAGVVPRDMDFSAGRMLSRQAVYEALELPMGLMSEASTEAHARVAERQLAEASRMRHVRTARKLTADGLIFWPRWQQLAVQFEDLSLRAADWDREAKRLAAVKPFMTVNEIRTQILHLPVVGWGEHREQLPAGDQPESDWRDSDSLQPERPLRDMVESTE